MARGWASPKGWAILGCDCVARSGAYRYGYASLLAPGLAPKSPQQTRCEFPAGCTNTLSGPIGVDASSH